MDGLAIELTDDEVLGLEAGDDLQFDHVKSNNFDAGTMSIILVTLTSPATIKILADLLRDILKQRRGGKIKINGMEVSDVSEATLLKLAAASTAPPPHDG
jgi:hypothetical protein